VIAGGRGKNDLSALNKDALCYTTAAYGQGARGFSPAKLLQNIHKRRKGNFP
jgi:hypothetical protein